jgi:hypothetical protein
MKIGIHCVRCVHERPGVEPPRIVGEIVEGGIVSASCPNGHATTYLLMDPLFEWLFEIGCLALLDGYHREAVIGFGTSLERFYEFCLKVLLARRDVDREAVGKLWDQLQKQSERQLGAFMATYVAETGKSYSMLTARDITLRNDVTHKGLIPTFKRASEYGATALSIIHRDLSELFPRKDDDMPPDLLKAFAMMLGERRAELLGRHAATLSMLSMVKLGSPATWGTGSFAERLDSLRSSRGNLYVKEGSP